MTKLSMGTGFAQLFKKYRLRSEIETLSEFGDLLAEEGFVYETSLFTRWQKSDRIPKERAVLLAILRVFMKRGGIVSIEEANTLFESVNQKNLTYEESTELSEYLQTANTKTLPVKPYLFIGREELLKDLTWKLINKKKVLLYGMPGVGKTYIAIFLAHQLKNFFPDGIFWFRADLKSADDIIDELLGSLGGKSFLSTPKVSRVEKLNQILVNRNILLVLDNTNIISEEDLKILTTFPVTLLITSIDKFTLPELFTLHIEIFDQHEFLQLCDDMLGKPYVKINEETIMKIGKELGFLPISLVISLKQIYADPTRIQEYINKLKEERVNIKDLTYDDKTLYVAINLAFNRLDKRAKRLLISCAAFEGTDFGLKALSSINNESLSEVKRSVNDLRELSFIEYSSIGRYRLHPAIRAYLLNKVEDIYVINLIQFYINNLKKVSIGSDRYLSYFNKEYENIIGSIRQGYKRGHYSLITQIWPLVSTYTFISGDWGKILEFSPIIEDSYRKINDKSGLVVYWIEDLGRVFFFQKDILNAKKLLQKSSVIAKCLKDNSLLGLISQKYGALYSALNKLDIAEDHLFDAIEKLECTNQIGQLAKTNAYLGMVYAKKGKNSLAIQQMGKALKEIEYIEDIPVIGYIYVYLGNSYLKINQLSDAEFYLRKGLKYSAKRNVLICCALAYEGLSELSRKENKMHLSTKYYTKATEIYSALGMQSHRSS